MNFGDPVALGRTGLRVGRLGIASSFGVPAAACEEAFARGCNYFTWGSFARGRSSPMRDAVRRIVRSGRRDDLVLALLAYSHSALLTEKFLVRGLRQLGVNHADVLLLGYYSRRPRRGILEGAQRLREKGLVRFIGITGHNRKLFPELERDRLLDVHHVRYNAAHRGAETETFTHLDPREGPGVVSFTATAWRRLLNPKKMPPGESPPTAADCYRFVLSHPSVHVCMVGARNLAQMRENLAVLESGPMSEDELARMRRIGDHVYGRRR